MKSKSFLITLFLVIAISLVLQVGFDTNLTLVSRYFAAQVGSAIGVSASVPANPFNTLEQQLRERELALIDKEQALKQKEEQLNEGQNRTAIYSSVAIGAVLLFLILLNFYLDRRRRNSI